MKNVLFVAPDHVGIIKMIREQLQQQDEYAVDFIDLVLPDAEKFRYKNFAHRLRNFYLKKFRNKNLKQAWYQERISGKIGESKPDYDVIVVIRPDLMNDTNLQLLRKLTRHYVAYYWDSVTYYPRKLQIRHFFDRVFSFDVQDCTTYSFEQLTNFYFFTEPPSGNKQDAYCLVTYDKRKDQLEKIAAEFEAKGITYCIKAHSKTPFKSNYITRCNEILDYGQMLSELAFSSVILEVQKADQRGLSFRPFEALGMKKKLITNNPMVKEYDFYSDHNICVIDPENISIPSSFFSTPYREIDPLILEKYKFSNWFNTLVSPLPSTFVA